MKFDFGDEVLLACSRWSGTPLRELGVVVGITLVDKEALVCSTGFPLGTVLYTIEFGDGTDALVPESDLCSTAE